MRAVGIRTSAGPDAVTVIERDVREPGPGEVRIRVAFAAVNPADVFMRRALGTRTLDAPLVPGLDAAGTVDALGPGVDRLAVGDAVMAVVDARRPEGGAQAERVVVPAASVVRVPEGVGLAAAATLPMTGLTALEGLRWLDLAPGATLAFTGGAGLLASYAIPLAKRRGLHVIADAGAGDEALVRRFGADAVVPRGDGYAAAVRQLVPEGADALFDAAALTRAVLPAVRDGGAIAVVRGWDDGPPPDRGIVVHAVSVGVAMQRTDWLQGLAAEAAAGTLALRVVGEYPPERAAEAQRRVEAGGLRGRLVIAF